MHKRIKVRDFSVRDLKNLRTCSFACTFCIPRGGLPEKWTGLKIRTIPRLKGEMGNISLDSD